MKRLFSLLIALCVLCTAVPALSEAPTVTAHVSQIAKFGHAKLDITGDDFRAAGFDPGDIVTVKAGSVDTQMPYLSSYSVESGEYMLRGFSGATYIAACINYGSFATEAGIDVGDPVVITLYEKGGAQTLQEMGEMLSFDDLGDADGKEAIFANFRPITLGEIAPGRLYRSASPLTNPYGRSVYADELIRSAGVKTVINLSESAADVEAALASEGPASSYYGQLYASGSVLALDLSVDFTSDAFGRGVVRGLTFLSRMQTPYLIHCIEGKDRTGFVAMVMQMLMGASMDEIVEDYMKSYENIYGTKSGTDRYDTIVRTNIMVMLRAVCGLEEGASLQSVDLRSCARDWLLKYGMAPEAIDALAGKLTDQ